MSQAARRGPSLISDAASAQAGSRDRWQALFGSDPPCTAMVTEQAVAWREQMLVYGDVSPATREALAVAAEQARTARWSGKVARVSTANDARPAPLLVPTPPITPAPPALTPGTKLIKSYGGKTHIVEVTADGLRYDGAMFASLSAIAKAITGTHWNGLLFFGLRKRKTYPKAGKP